MKTKFFLLAFLIVSCTATGFFLLKKYEKKNAGLVSSEKRSKNNLKARHYLELMDQYQKEGRSDLAAEAHNKAVVIGDDETFRNFFQERYQKEVQRDDSAHEYLRRGDLLSKQGQLNSAANEYREAYLLGGMSRSVSGILLAQTYEKLNRYDEAISLLNQMIEKRQLSDSGIQDARAMIERLTANKNQTL